MATETSRFGLYKADPVIDENDTFSLKTLLNDNWDKLDAKAVILSEDGKIPFDDPLNRITADSIEDGLIELFTFANNGKTDISSVIGSPALSSNTFTQLKSHIQTHKTDISGVIGSPSLSTNSLNQLRSYLQNARTNIRTAIGSPALADDTLAQLKDRITTHKSELATVIGSPAVAGDTLAQLKTHAQDGKSNIASAIGSPATNNESLVQLGTHLGNNKNNLASHLVNHGLTAAGSESLASLVAKVPNIVTGRKVYEGAASSVNDTKMFNIYNGQGSFIYVEVVAPFGFVPTTILLQEASSGSIEQEVSVTVVMPFENHGMNIFVGEAYPQPIGTIYRRVFLSGNAYVNANGFCLPVDLSGSWTNEVLFRFMAIE